MLDIFEEEKMLSRRSIAALFNARSCFQSRYRSAKVTTASEDHYEQMASKTLDNLVDYLDSFPDHLKCDDEYDVNSSMGVITAKISQRIGTYVINKQTPNRQIWLSSPISGPKRFDLVNEKWISTRDNLSLDALLNSEFREIFQTEEIDFTKHL